MSITFRKRKPRKTAVAAVENHPGRQSFVEFVRHVKPSLTITKQIRLLAQKVEGPLLRGEGWLRLILVWPPRTGKTTAGSVLLLAWIFGLQPEWEAIVGSLSGKLATKIGAKVRRIIGSRQFAEVFPGVRLSKHTNGKTEFSVTNEGSTVEGYFFASGRNTRATGQGAKVLFFDDLIGEKETDSEPALEDAQDAIQMFRSRGAPDGFHWIICNTRYREDDPIGYILDQYRSDGPWDLVTLPVVVEEDDEEKTYQLDRGEPWFRPVGDILFPYIRATIDARRAVLFDQGKQHEWFGQYKCLPRPPQGVNFDTNWFKRYDESPASVRIRCDRVVLSADTAKRDKDNSDPTAILIWGEQGERRYLLHVELGRWLFDEILVKLAELAQEWKPNVALLELAGSGEQAAAYLQKHKSVRKLGPDGMLLCEIPWRTEIHGIEVAGAASKVIRFNACIPDIRQGFVWLPVAAPWLAKYERELANFPKGHDDQCDATSQYLNWLRTIALSKEGRRATPPDVARFVAPLGSLHGHHSDPASNWLTRF